MIFQTNTYGSTTTFFGAAIVEIVEAWIKKGIFEPGQVVA